MSIEQIFCFNPLRNFNYLLWDNQTRDAICIDPLDVPRVMGKAQELDLNIRKIYITHGHFDHCGGVGEIQALTSATLLEFSAQERQEWGDYILWSEKTPGHYADHQSLFYSHSSGQKGVFCGDTVFHAGVGNCRQGNVHQLYQSLVQYFFPLASETVLYPGHDYVENNLKFAQSLVIEEKGYTQLLHILSQRKEVAWVKTVGWEREWNPFFQLSDAKWRNVLSLPDASDEEIFVELRKKRDAW